jgi:DNA-binding HxlR family transcriptional regulator
MPMSEIGPGAPFVGYPTVLYNKYRLAIMYELYVAGAVEFVQLKSDLSLRDGALATHIRTLQRNGLVTAQKEPFGARTRTVYLITPKGISLLRKFFAHMAERGSRILNE